MKDCYSISNGILHDGIYQAISLFNDNINVMFNNIKSISFDTAQYMINERLIDMYLKHAYNDFVLKYEEINLTDANNGHQVAQICMIVFIVILFFFVLIVQFCYLTRIKSKFTEILTLLCILPFQSLNNPEILPKLMYLELE